MKKMQQTLIKKKNYFIFIIGIITTEQKITKKNEKI